MYFNRLPSQKKHSNVIITIFDLCIPNGHVNCPKLLCASRYHQEAKKFKYALNQT